MLCAEFGQQFWTSNLPINLLDKMELPVLKYWKLDVTAKCKSCFEIAIVPQWVRVLDASDEGLGGLAGERPGCPFNSIKNEPEGTKRGPKKAPKRLQKGPVSNQQHKKGTKKGPKKGPKRGPKKAPKRA